MDTNGFYGDTFSSGFGDFYTAKRSLGPTGGKETPFSEARKFYSQEPEFAFLAPNRLKVTKFHSKKKKSWNCYRGDQKWIPMDSMETLFPADLATFTQQSETKSDIKGESTKLSTVGWAGPLSVVGGFEFAVKCLGSHEVENLCFVHLTSCSFYY